MRTKILKLLVALLFCMLLVGCEVTEEQKKESTSTNQGTMKLDQEVTIDPESEPSKPESTGFRYYVLNEEKKTCTIRSVGTCADIDVVVPASIDGYTVKSINTGAFSNCVNIKSITLPSTITLIDEYAFLDCSALESIMICDGVREIGPSAFANCSALKTISLPDSVTSLGYSAFSGCSSLTSVKLSNQLTNIAHDTFQSCHSIRTITIPQSVKKIENNVFSGCGNLVEIINHSTLKIVVGDEIAGQVLEVHDGESKIDNVDDYLFYPCGDGNIYCLAYLGEDVELVLPDNYNSQDYMIYEGAFAGCSGLTSITIPGSVKKVGEVAFRNCIGLKNVVMEEGVLVIGNGAFSGCSEITGISIPSSITHGSDGGLEFGENFVYNQKNGINYIGNEENPYVIAISAVSPDITEILIEKSCKIIYCQAFSNCYQVVEVVIPEGVISIGYAAFAKCKNMERVTIADSVSNIGNGAFYECVKLRDVRLSNSITWIGTGMFYGCENLTVIAIPEGVTSIGFAAFSNCTKLERITIPSSVTSIDGSAFEWCPALKTKLPITQATEQSTTGEG